MRRISCMHLLAILLLTWGTPVLGKQSHTKRNVRSCSDQPMKALILAFSYDKPVRDNQVTATELLSALRNDNQSIDDLRSNSSIGAEKIDLPKMRRLSASLGASEQKVITGNSLLLELIPKKSDRLRAKRLLRSLDQLTNQLPFEIRLGSPSGPGVTKTSAVNSTNREREMEKIRQEIDDMLPKNGRALKQAVLATLAAKRSQLGADGSEVLFIYSGHGVRCGKHADNWCMAIPVYRFSSRSDESILISDEEILEAVRPAGAILDSCFSGAMGKTLIQMKRRIGRQVGTFLFSSSLDSESSEDTAAGGVLINALSNIISAKPKELCNIDLNNDGMISDFEVAAALTLGQFSDYSLFSKAGRSHNDNDDGKLHQMGVYIPLNRCLFALAPGLGCKRDVAVEAPLPQDKEPDCDNFVRDSAATLASLDRFRRDPKLLRFVYRPLRQASAAELMQQDRSNAARAARLRSLAFFEKWAEEHKIKQNECVNTLQQWSCYESYSRQSSEIDRLIGILRKLGNKR